MTSRMSEVLVYKIPDDVWDRYFNLFQIKLFDGIFLECKPSGYTHNDELIYSRFARLFSSLLVEFPHHFQNRKDLRPQNIPRRRGSVPGRASGLGEGLLPVYVC